MPSPLRDISLQTPLGPVIAEGRVLDAVAGRDLRGTLDDIADALGISYSDLRVGASTSWSRSAGSAWSCWPKASS